MLDNARNVHWIVCKIRVGNFNSFVINKTNLPLPMTRSITHNKQWSQNVIDKPIYLSLFIFSGQSYSSGRQLSLSLKDRIQQLQSKYTQNGSLISSVTRLTTFSQSVGSPRFKLRRATEPVLLLGQDCIYRTKLVTGP